MFFPNSKDGSYSVFHGGKYSVNVPSKGVKFVRGSSKSGDFKLYHYNKDLTAPKKCTNKESLKRDKSWNKLNEHAMFCLGHDMSLRKFLDTYCDGKLPPE